ncbi:hypothetical protein VF14_02915 [Nostoc linckia z18]|uniref:Uncharacterized protein n=2 Tax=Nostoc linckia TaxID=92942 RepID=A0A9Q5ZH58_NOSLI|nr:hypothetical protein [Nostoc linckia]PHK39167.1 hypothetical protein VF12_15205 [Nostoc linckia z15]PHK46777.1 hypothetical protein VF13_08800 [Nostoc linckia z16]PHJ69106.1 hypothetical protein VF02_00385 [Nostoc linckia z1]PHJ73257.1 hypothetical protein VF05_01400 [Nostoc linckia z3]PHJ78604.1 hypothetical protein VF03_00385 [Nostoc linckia z2]
MNDEDTAREDKPPIAYGGAGSGGTMFLYPFSSVEDSYKNYLINKEAGLLGGAATSHTEETISGGAATSNINQDNLEG